MFSYLLFNFLFYAFLGYWIEQIYTFATQGHFKTEGFLYGPFKPMYGFAMTFLIFSKLSLGLGFGTTLVLAFIIPSLVEYLSGLIIKSLCGTLYWDYSTIYPNFQGLICLPFSICWMVLCLLGIYTVQPFVNLFFSYTIGVWHLLTWPILIYLVIDFLFTLKRLTVVS